MSNEANKRQSIDLREYCGWRGNTEESIVTDGTIYHDTSSNGWKNGKRVFKNCWRAEITIDGKRYRHRSKDRKDCEDWLKAVCQGKIKPTDNRADWMRMEQKKDMEVRYDEIIVSAYEEAQLLYDYHQTGDLTKINDYLFSRLLPHMIYYCCHTLRLGLSTSISYTRQAAGLLLERIVAGHPVPNFTAACKRMLKVRHGHRDFWYYEKAPKSVQMIVNGFDYSLLAEVWKVTKDKRL